MLKWLQLRQQVGGDSLGQTLEGFVSHCDVLGDEQLLPPGVGLHLEVAVVDEQHLQDVLGELGSPSHVQPCPQQLWGDRGRVVSALGLAGWAFGKEFPPSA